MYYNPQYKSVHNLVFILGGIIFGTYNQSSSLACASVNCLNNIDHFLLVIEGPIDLVVVARTKINHDVSVTKEKHDRAGIVQLIPKTEQIQIRDKRVRSCTNMT